MSEPVSPPYMGDYLGAPSFPMPHEVMFSGPEEPESASVIATKWAIRVAGAAAAGAAIYLSYQRNKSVPWAFGSGLIAPLYLGYRGLEHLSGKK